jgi:hypothetical protein
VKAISNPKKEENENKNKKEDENKLANKLFEIKDSHAERGNLSISVKFTLCKVHVVPGSVDSIEFH